MRNNYRPTIAQPCSEILLIILAVPVYYRMSDFRNIAEIHANAQLSEILRSSLSPCPHSAPVSGLVAET